MAESRTRNEQWRNEVREALRKRRASASAIQERLDELLDQ